MVKWFKPLEDEFESVIEWLLYFDRHWYINSGAITDISVHEPDIHVLSKVCRVSLTSVGILSTLCSVPSLSSSCQTNDELNGELYHYEIQTNMIFLSSYQYKKMAVVILDLDSAAIVVNFEMFKMME